MSEYRRAINLDKPGNLAAKEAANRAVAGETGGRKINLSEAELRKKWMDAYIAAGGEYEVIKRRRKKPKTCKEPCPVKKTVTVKVIAVTFLNDHQSAGNKLLKKAKTERIKSSWRDKHGVTHSINVDSKLGDGFTEYMKPEWDLARGGSADSHPVSYTKNLQKKIRVKFDFTVTPDGESAEVEEIKGTSGERFLSYEKMVSRTVKSETIEEEFISIGNLPNYVDLLEESIDWQVKVDGEVKSAGQTGKHKFFVTFDEPKGKMASPSDNVFSETGSDQVVTDERLEFAVRAAQLQGVSDEIECVDAIFVKLLQNEVGYTLHHRWEPGAINNTWVDPKPSLHHYLWLCNQRYALGECHNIAAAFVLACRILGVKESFAVGYMYPWPSRLESHPTYPKSSIKSSSSKNILGKLDLRYSRPHSGEGHGIEKLMFLDGSGAANNFEGVAVYKGKVLYAIGDDVFDLYPDPHDNASAYFAQRTARSSGNLGLRLSASDFNIGAFELKFTGCNKPYPWVTTGKFKWED